MLRMKLTANLHFFTAQLEARNVSVYQDNEEIEQGNITEITAASIKINDSWYFREVCDFYIKN